MVKQDSVAYSRFTYEYTILWAQFYERSYILHKVKVTEVDIKIVVSVVIDSVWILASDRENFGEILTVLPFKPTLAKNSYNNT